MARKFQLADHTLLLFVLLYYTSSGEKNQLIKRLINIVSMVLTLVMEI